MIQYLRPVRKNTPQPFVYNFVDQDGEIINLTPYVSVFLVLKLQGQVYVTLAGTFVAPRSLGQVTAGPYAHTQTGIWVAQFYIVDGSNNVVWGEPLEYNVVPNVPDLSLTQLPIY